MEEKKIPVPKVVPEEQVHVSFLIPESKKTKLRLYLLKNKKNAKAWILEQIEKIGE